MTRLEKHAYFMGIALAVAKRSPCLSRQVGCVFIDEHSHILSTGYNGVPKNLPHCEVCIRKEPSRDLYSCRSVHSEMNGLLQCPDVNKIDTVYVTINPCNICMRLLANTSAQTVIINEAYTFESLDQFEHFWLVELRRKKIMMMNQR